MRGAVVEVSKSRPFLVFLSGVQGPAWDAKSYTESFCNFDAQLQFDLKAANTQERKTQTHTWKDSQKKSDKKHVAGALNNAT